MMRIMRSFRCVGTLAFVFIAILNHCVAASRRESPDGCPMRPKGEHIHFPRGMMKLFAKPNEPILILNIFSDYESHIYKVTINETKYGLDVCRTSTDCRRLDEEHSESDALKVNQWNEIRVAFDFGLISVELIKNWRRRPVILRFGNTFRSPLKVSILGVRPIDHDQTSVPPNIDHNQTAVPLNIDHNQTAVPLNIDHNQTAVPLNIDHDQTSVPPNIDHNQTSVPPNIDHNQTEVPPNIDHNQTEVPPNIDHDQTSVPPNIDHDQTAVPLNIDHDQTEVPPNIEHNQTEVPPNIDHDQTSVLPSSYSVEVLRVPCVDEEKTYEVRTRPPPSPRNPHPEDGNRSSGVDIDPKVRSIILWVVLAFMIAFIIMLLSMVRYMRNREKIEDAEIEEEKARRKAEKLRLKEEEQAEQIQQDLLLEKERKENKGNEKKEIKFSVP